MQDLLIELSKGKDGTDLHLIPEAPTSNLNSNENGGLKGYCRPNYGKHSILHKRSADE